MREADPLTRVSPISVDRRGPLNHHGGPSYFPGRAGARARLQNRPKFVRRSALATRHTGATDSVHRYFVRQRRSTNVMLCRKSLAARPLHFHQSVSSLPRWIFTSRPNRQSRKEANNAASSLPDEVRRPPLPGCAYALPSMRRRHGRSSIIRICRGRRNPPPLGMRCLWRVLQHFHSANPTLKVEAPRLLE